RDGRIRRVFNLLLFLLLFPFLPPLNFISPCLGLLLLGLCSPRRRRRTNRGTSSHLEILKRDDCDEADDYDRSNLDRLASCIHDLVMWEDVAKSSLWFGVGCLGFLSSCFVKGINFRNLAISKTRKLFSGEPSMTLKVITTEKIDVRFVADI
ncbi:Reticulon-like protein B17, partial [Linum perenne]